MEMSINGAKVLATFENVPILGTVHVTQTLVVSWLVMIVISALLAILEKGAETLQTAMQVPTSISDIVTGILLFCMLGCEFFINYRMIFRRKQAEAPAAPAAAESDQTESKEDASC